MIPDPTPDPDLAKSFASDPNPDPNGSGSDFGSGSTTLHYLNLRSLRQISSSFVHGQKTSFSSFLSRRKGLFRLFPDANLETFKKDH